MEENRYRIAVEKNICQMTPKSFGNIKKISKSAIECEKMKKAKRRRNKWNWK